LKRAVRDLGALGAVPSPDSYLGLH